MLQQPCVHSLGCYNLLTQPLTTVPSIQLLFLGLCRLLDALHFCRLRESKQELIIRLHLYLPISIVARLACSFHALERPSDSTWLAHSWRNEERLFSSSWSIESAEWCQFCSRKAVLHATTYTDTALWIDLYDAKMPQRCL